MSTGTVVAAYLHGGHVAHSFHHSCRNLWIWDATHHRRIIGFIGQECGAGRITDGRNDVVRRFLATDAEWLLFIDSDMGFDPDAVDRLVAAADPVDRPVVGGLCFGQRRGAVGPAGSVRLQQFPTIYQWVMGGITGCAPIHDYPADSLVRCDATGAAFLLIHRSALETLRGRYDEPRPWFDEMIQAGRVFGEDLTFCWRLRESGVPLHVHTGVRTSHYKHGYLTDETQQALENIPTFVVIPMKDRLDLTRALVEQLVEQGEATGIFVLDNGSSEETKIGLKDLAELPGVDVGDAAGLNLHQMWNAGLNEAQRRAWPCNVAILNNDLKIGPRFLSGLAGALRADPLLAVVSPNYDGRAGVGVQQVTDICAGRYDGTGGLAGFAFMLKIESGYRFPEQLQWWYGDNDMLAHVHYGGSTAGIVLGTTVEHVGGGSQTGDWDAMRDTLARDREWFEAKWRVADGCH